MEVSYTEAVIELQSRLLLIGDRGCYKGHAGLLSDDLYKSTHGSILHHSHTSGVNVCDIMAPLPWDLPAWVPARSSFACALIVASSCVTSTVYTLSISSKSTN